MVLFFMSDVIVASVIAAAVGATVAFFWLRSKGVITITKVEKAQPTDPIVVGLRENAVLFGQLYEAMYLVSKGRSAKIRTGFAAWNNRVDTLDDDSEFVIAFREAYGDYEDWKEKKAVKKAGKLVKAFKKAGILRDKDVSVFAEDDFAEKYNVVGGIVEEGEELDVLSPFWSFEGEVIEKGVAR
ncbi:MAG: hypothetical protein E7523_05195 [Ruminococcaceae bacterium]|nr:hypothetical protein [Oscillospiraceae bacterium]